MRLSSLGLGLLGLFSITAYAGGTVAPAPEEAPAAATAPAPLPPQPAPAPAAAPAAVPEVQATPPQPLETSFEPHLYAGASIGETDYSGSTFLGATLVEPSHSSGAKSLFNKVFFGYRFIPHLALEFDEIDLGKSANITGVGSSLDVLGILPVGSCFDLFGKLGVADMEAHGATSNGGYHTGLNFGIGTDYHINKIWSARAEIEHFRKVGNDLKANLFSLGLQYGF